MPIGYGRWELRDSSDRTEVQQAVDDYCNALRATKWVDDARFYWAPDGSVVVLTFASEIGTVNSGLETRLGKALFFLGDLARQTHNEIWLEPRIRDVRTGDESCLHPSTVSVIAGGLERIVCERCGRVMLRHRSTISSAVDRKMFARRADRLP